MNLKSTPNNLAKLEKIFEEAKYILRYEKGTFNSGYCILEHKKVVVINKFLNMEGKINTLMDILPSIALDEGFLTPDSQKMYRQIKDNRDAVDAAEAATDAEEAGADVAETEGATDAEETSAEAATDIEEAGADVAETETATDAEEAGTDVADDAASETPAEDTAAEENPNETPA